MKRDGLLQASRWVRYYLAVYEKYFSRDPLFEELNRDICKIIAQSNHFFISTTKTLVPIFSSQQYESEKEMLSIIKEDVAKKEFEYLKGLEKIFGKFQRAKIVAKSLV